jgi:DNA-binding NarL/FixJ family response regulator
MDRELVVQGAQGESILRLPWFEEGLFVGRQLPDIHEMPSSIRKLCVDTYSAGFSGERGSFEFTSYGHAYAVDAVPVRAAEGGRVEAVLAVATPVSDFSSAAAAYQRMAERLDSFAATAEERARRSLEAGRDDTRDQQAAARARCGAERCRASARQIRPRDAGRLAGPVLITSRQSEVLELASHGLTTTEIAEQLNVSDSTVKTHFENIYARLGVGDRTTAVAVALRHGLIE